MVYNNEVIHPIILYEIPPKPLGFHVNNSILLKTETNAVEKSITFIMWENLCFVQILQRATFNLYRTNLQHMQANHKAFEQHNSINHVEDRKHVGISFTSNSIVNIVILMYFYKNLLLLNYKLNINLIFYTRIQ